FKLFNINAEKERDIFIFQPKFIILDEVHIYNGIFGAFTSLLLRRYKRIRKERFGDNDDLRIIGASATIQNKEDLFTKLSGCLNPKIIEETFEDINANNYNINDSIPLKLLKQSIGSNNFIGIITKCNIGNLNSIISSSDFSLKSEEEKLEFLRNYLYDFFVEDNPNNYEDIFYKLIRLFYTLCKSKPKLISRLKEDLKSRIEQDINNNELNILFNNLYFIGSFTGIIENRIHLFSWPMDGYYGCIQCGALYTAKVDKCKYCGEDFITKIVICAHCGEKFYESWYCPVCNHIYPSDLYEEDFISYFEIRKCSGGGFHNEEIECSKIIWKPTFKCNRCGTLYEPMNIYRCKNNNCNNNILDYIPDEGIFYCNICGKTYTLKEINNQFKSCPECNSSSFHLLNIEKENNTLKCSKCGIIIEKNKEEINFKCNNCDGLITPFLKIPWVCLKCGKKYFKTKPPTKCENVNCNSKSFALNGLFEINTKYICEKCKRVYITPQGCAKEDHKSEIHKSFSNYRKYKMIHQDFSIRSFRAQNKKAFFDGRCYHQYKSNYIGKRFDSLFYTPIHTAITSATFLLRYYLHLQENEDVDTFNYLEGLKEAKLLSFSDSVNEMEELGTKFREPEYELFIDHLVYKNLKKNEYISLKQLQYAVFEDIKNYFFQISPRNTNDEIEREIEIVFKDILKTRRHNVKSKIFKHIENRIIKLRHPRNFVKIGLANFKIEDINKLNKKEKQLFMKILKSHRDFRKETLLVDYKLITKKKNKENQIKKLIESDNDAHLIERLKQEIYNIELEILQSRKNYQIIFETLKNKGFVFEENNKIFINPEKILCFLVNENNLINYDFEKDIFLPDFFINNKSKLIEFRISPENRNNIYKDKFFSRNIYRILNFPLVFLKSEVYRGSTKAYKRRAIEYKFKNTVDINFLSSGPAMEIGIDIGDLNILLLYGTPPNINSYLQRIGRAGRSDKRSLIVSISKRNPIDYYYFNNPLDLISSESQPVPLTIINLEIIKISLSWAILDYITNRYKILWEKDNTRNKVKVNGLYSKYDDSFISSSGKILKFSNLLDSKIDELQINLKRVDAFEIIAEIINRDMDEIEQYLKSIFDFKFCLKCNKIYENGITFTECPIENCNGDIININQFLEERNIFKSVINNFSDIFLFYFLKMLKILDNKYFNLESKHIEIRRKLRYCEDENEEFLEEEYHKIGREMEILNDLIKKIKEMKFYEFMKNSIMRKYFFNIRDIDDEIEIYKIKKDENKIKKIPSGTRNLTLALREYFPYAKVFSQMKEFFIVKLEEDKLKLKDLNEKLLEFLNQYKYCVKCNEIFFDNGEKTCVLCNSQLIQLENFIPKSVDILFEKLPINLNADINEKKVFPHQIFPLYKKGNPKTHINNTYTKDSKYIYEFLPEKGIRFKNVKDNTILFDLTFGLMKMGIFTENFNVSYRNGIYDKKKRFFIICGHNDCNTILEMNNNYICPKDKSHRKKKYIRLIRDFYSKGIEIKFYNTEDSRLAHTFAHGLKLALQKIAGVEIRSIGEAEGYKDEPLIYIFDNALGGNGVCETLFHVIEGEYINLIKAINILKQNFESCCSMGCPHCIFQFGCYKLNSLDSFNKEELLEILNKEFRIEEIEDYK
ncbi:MAG: helicase-related protein, partial [Promethearchaeota archaeon]